MIASSIRVALLAAAFAMITMAVGWWGVAPVGVLWGWLSGRAAPRPVLHAASAAAAGWAGWLVLATSKGELGELAGRLGTVLGLPAAVPIIVTVTIAALLAALGTWLGLTIPKPSVPSQAR